MCPRHQYTDLTYMGGTRSCGPMFFSSFSLPTSVWIIQAFVQNQSIALCARTLSCLPQTGGRTDRLSTNFLEFRTDQMSPRNLGSQINIFGCYTHIDKTNIFESIAICMMNKSIFNFDVNGGSFSVWNLN